MVFEGENGQGKTNLLEAIHILSVGKSTRTSSDRDLIPQYPELASNQEMYSRIAAEISTENETTQLQIDFQSSRVEQTSESQFADTNILSVRKFFKVNGVSKRASAITPVPGGVGPMTIAMLLSNTIDAVGFH